MRTVFATTILCALAANDAQAWCASSPEETTPYREFAVLHEQVFRDQLWDSYQRSRIAGGGCDGRMEEIVDGAVRLYFTSADRPDPARFLNTAGGIWRTCDNIVLTIARALALDDLNNRDSAIAVYREVLEKAASGRDYLHPAVHARIAVNLGRLMSRMSGREDLESTYASLAIDKLIEASELVPNDAGQQRLFLDHIRSTFGWPPLGDDGHRLVEAMARQETFDEYTILMSSGIVELARAWRARGEGLARTVTPGGWEKFHRHVDRAGTQFRRAYEIDSTRPEAPTQLISVIVHGIDDRGETARLWLDRALAAQDDWYPAYRGYLHYLQPRWGGSHRQMIEFARECLAKNSFDTYIPLTAINVAVYAVNDAQGRHYLIRDLNLFPLLRSALEGLIASPAHEREREYYQALLFVSAWASDEYDFAASLLDSLPQTRGSLRAWERFEADPQSTIADVRLFSTEHADRIRKADALVESRRMEDAIDLYAALIDESEDKHVQQLLRDRMVVAQQIVKFESGEWVPLTFDEHLTGWEQVRPRWTPVGVSVQMHRSYQRPMLISRLPVGHNWELIVQFSMPERAWPQTDAAILLGYADSRYSPHARFVSVRPNQNEIAVGFVRVGMTRELFPLEMEGQRSFEVHLYSWGDDVAVKVNGEVIFTGQPPAFEDREPGDRIGLGGIHDWPARPVDFLAPRIRKLTEKPEILIAQE